MRQECGRLTGRPAVEIISQFNFTFMTFIEQFERDFAVALQGDASEAELVRWASERVLESYRNGITAGQKGATVKRQGKSRRRDPFGKTE